MSLLRRVSQLHEDDRVVAFAATPLGRFALWLVATGLLLRGPDAALLMSPILALMLIVPEKRHAIIAIGSLGAYYKVAIARGLVEPWPLLAGLVGVLAYSYVGFRLTRRFESLPGALRRYPLLFAHLPMLALVGLLWAQRGFGEPLVLAPITEALLSLLPFFVWRWSFLMLSGRRGEVAGTRFVDHLLYLLPVFGGTSVPFGKGHGYLSSRAAKTPLELTRSQLAGVKLLVLGTLWSGARILIEVGIHGVSTRRISPLFAGWSLDLTSLASQLAREDPGDVAAPMAWLMLALALITQVLGVAAMGHHIVGSLRLCGYNVFRNTYKPLLAESIVAYWNRFYYYFKELLVELFFFPTFLAAARLPMNFRIFAAAMAAAFLGNLYFHVLRDVGLYLVSTNDEIMAVLIPRAFYSFALGLGVFVSMLRERKRRRRRGPARAPLVAALVRLRRILGVWVFYGLLLVWVAGPESVGFGKRAEFALALIGIR